MHPRNAFLSHITLRLIPIRANKYHKGGKIILHNTVGVGMVQLTGP